jgi:transposase
VAGQAQCLKPDEVPPRQFHKRLKSVLDPFESYLVKRWAEGCTTASVLCREIKALEYTGSCKMVEGWVYRQREAMKTAGNKRPMLFPGQGFGSRDLAWLLMREEAELSDDARAIRDCFLRAWPELERVQGLALELIRMVRNRQEAGFDAWLQRVKSCSVQALQAFAVGLERETDAVRAALSSCWSNGPTEGVVNRIKLVKRMMYGRASVPLLRKMVVLDE